MKKTIRMIALLVSITLFFQELPVITARAAQENQPDHQQEAEVPKEEAGEPRIVAELVEKRTETEKHFLLSDGTFQVAQYAQPVHYEDSDGYTEINNELVEATDAQGDTVYKNTESDFHVAFAQKADSKKLVTVTYEDHEISWGFVLEGQGRKGKKQPFSKPGKSRKASAKSEDPLENTRIADAGSYVDLYPGVDVKYELVSKQLKENIILRNKKAASQALVIEVRHPGLTAEKTPEGSISFADEAGRQIYLFEAPYMYDSNGETSDQVSLDIIASQNGQTRLKVVPDAQWLADRARAYPVTIDPITKTAQSPDHIETRYYTQNNKNLSAYGVLYAGNQKGQMGQVKTAVRFDLPKLPTTTAVLKATMYLAHRDYSSVGVSESTVNVCAVTEDWTASEQVPGVAGQAPAHSPYAQDYNTLGTGTKRTMVSWDITGIASQWFNGTLDNHGVLVYPEDPEEWALVDFVSPQNPGYGSGALPIMVISYREACGLEDYWSYSTQDCGRYGKGYINNYNGNLVYIHEDTSFQSVINGFTLAHVYNTCGSETEGRYGKGWRLNLVQRLEPVSVSGFREYKYVYTDGDGTRHYFYENEKGEVIDEDGLGYTVLDYPGTELTKKITTKDGTELVFDLWHYLRVIRDTNGNTINMNYSPIPGVDNYLTSITTSSGGAIRLHYDSDYQLQSIEDNAGRRTYFNRENGLLKRIVYPDGITADLNYYDSWFHGISASDGTELAYGNYVKHGKIYCAEKKSSDGEEGEYYLYFYGHNQTTIRDHFGRTTTYQFDSMGRAVCVFDDEKNVCAQQYTVSSNSSGEARKNNKVTGVSNAAVYVDNLIKNPVFSDGLSYWNIHRPGEGSTISLSGSDKFLSGNRVRMHNDSEAITVLMQSPAVDTGTTYTVSAYVKTEDVVSERFGAGIEVVTSDRYLYSDMVTGTTDTDIQDGYCRVSCTFELAGNESLLRITAGLYNATGTAYIDGLQLEKGAVCNTVNLLSNSGFEQGTTYWTAGTDDPGTCRTDSDSFEGDRAYRIDGRHDKDRSVSQTVYCTGEAGAVFAFGAWTKGYSVGGHEEASPYRLECTLHYTDGSEKTETVEYNTVVNAWQFGMKNLVAEKPYTYAQLTFRYNKNCNFAVLDDVFLYRDSMQSYRYDDQGNVVATSDYASQRSEYKYNNDNLSRLFTPEGSSYEYLYDEKKNNVAARSGDGLLYQITYDGTGNPIRSDITASDATASIKDGGIYRLRLKYTGKYLALKNGGTSSGTEVVQASFSGGEEQKWRAEKTADGYYRLRPVSAGTLALDFDSSGNGTVVAASGADSQKLTPIPQSDYTYKLLVKGYTTRTLVTVNYSPTREAVVALYEMGIENNPEQEWYLEEAGGASPDTIEEGIYQVQSRACGKVFTLSEEGRTGLQANGYLDTQRFVIRPVAGTAYCTLSPASAPERFLCCPQGEEDHGIILTSDGTDGTTRFQIVKDTLADSWRIVPASEEGKMLSLSEGGYEDTREVVLAGASSALDGLFAFVKTSQSIRTSQSYQYNGNLPYQVTDARGNTTTYTYDYSRGLRTAVTDARGNVTSYTYQDENDRLLAVTAGGSTVSYGYHADGTLESITSPSGIVYGFAYDTYKRQTGVTVGGAQLSATQYKNNYQTLVDTLTYGNGSSVGYRYDRLDRLTEKRYNGSVAARYTYDRLGRLARTEDLVRGTVTEMEYDLTGRLLSIRNAESAAGAEEGVYTRGRADLARLEYAYDDLARVSRIRQTAAGSTVSYGLEYATANTGTKKLGRISGVLVNGTRILEYTYDALGRSAARTLGTTVPFVTEYSYLPGGDAAKTTALVQTLESGGDTYTYTYDELGNLTTVSVNGTLKESYTYDALGQLTGAVMGEDTYAYTYDAGGNLTARTKNGETVAVYGYDDEHWADLLTSYNGVSIAYDGIGNPSNWKNGETFTWSNGRQLTGITTEGGSIAYTYDESGQRTGKDVNGEKTAYYWLNGQLLGQKSENEAIYFLYDETGSAFGMIYNGVYYYYELNLQGDIIGIIDSTGSRVVEYDYGAWGELLSITGTLADTVGQKNPLRYRGYYYDGETGFYYLNSRYYDPEVGRFINADGYVSTGQGILGINMFAYCGNNPVNRLDSSGMFWKEIGNWFKKAWNSLTTWASNTFGAGSSTSATITKTEVEYLPDPLPITAKTGTKTTQTVSKHGNSSKPVSVYAKRDAEHPIKSSSAGIKLNIAKFTLDISLGLDNIGISGSIANSNTTNGFGIKANLSELKVGFEGSSAIKWDNTTETTYTNVSVSGWTLAAAYILVTTWQPMPSPSYTYRN